MQNQLVELLNIISIDPGDSISGFCVIEKSKISFAANLPNQLVVPKIQELLQIRHYIILIEDVRAYGTRLSPQLLLTTKYIGQLEWRLNELLIAFDLIPRFEVKKWVYDTFPEIVLPRISKKVALEDRRREKDNVLLTEKGKKQRKRLRTSSGDLHKGNFVWVDDRIVQAAMAHYWGIKKPKPGKPTDFGLKSHSWQALGISTMFISRKLP